eukprot:m.69009 g.69009  ORF g.69009 m.69009 type:complete len:125 (-) comp9946_c0_seq3:1940-2314(-)
MFTTFPSLVFVKMSAVTLSSDIAPRIDKTFELSTGLSPTALVRASLSSSARWTSEPDIAAPEQAGWCFVSDHCDCGIFGTTDSTLQTKAPREGSPHRRYKGSRPDPKHLSRPRFTYPMHTAHNN